MMRFRELAFRSSNALLIGALRSLHRRFKISTTYKLGPDGASALFEDCWFTYNVGEFGCTGNIDYAPDAENSTRNMLFGRVKATQVFYDIGSWWCVQPHPAQAFSGNDGAFVRATARKTS